MLKPFGGERNVSYVVVAPDNDLVIKGCKKFFTELSLMYSQCQLGRHKAYQAQRDGIVRVGKHLASTIGDKSTSDWFNRLGTIISSPNKASPSLFMDICGFYVLRMSSAHGIFFSCRLSSYWTEDEAHCQGV